MKLKQLMFCLMSIIVIPSTVSANQSSRKEQYLEGIKKLGSRVETGSEGQTDIAVRELFKSPVSCKDRRDFNMIIKGNDELATDTFLNEIILSEQQNLRDRMRVMIKKMQNVELYVVGCKEDEKGFELTNWNLVGDYEGSPILLSHERVYT